MGTKKAYAREGGPAGPPLHPGKVLRERVLPALGMSVSASATELGVSRQTLHEILAEKRGVSPEMAVRLGKWCGNGPGLWLRLQEAVDLHHAQKRLRGKLKKIPTHRDSEAA